MRGRRPKENRTLSISDGKKSHPKIDLKQKNYNFRKKRKLRNQCV